MALLILVAPFVGSRKSYASEVSNRTLRLSSSVASANTRHQISFRYTTSASIGSIDIQYCTNSPVDIDPCTAPTGLDVSNANLLSESGATGFSVHASTNANRIVLTRTAAAVSAPQSATYLFDTIINPSVQGTHYARIGTYASTDGTGAKIDYGGLAFSINLPIDVGAYVPPILLFCVGISIPTNDCSSASGDSIDFGLLTKDTTSYGSTQLLAATNGYNGYTITINGTTMTSGNNVITGLTSQSASQTNASQFGINLRNNSAPDVGADKSGVGTGSVMATYNTANQYKFVPGETIARATTSTDINKYTVSYIVNIEDDQPPGVYSTTLTYIALASF